MFYMLQMRFTRVLCVALKTHMEEPRYVTNLVIIVVTVVDVSLRLARLPIDLSVFVSLVVVMRPQVRLGSEEVNIFNGISWRD